MIHLEEYLYIEITKYFPTAMIQLQLLINLDLFVYDYYFLEWAYKKEMLLFLINGFALS